MPTTKLKNLLYRTALPFGLHTHIQPFALQCAGHPLQDAAGLCRIARKNHLLNGRLYLEVNNQHALITLPSGREMPQKYYRIASITKTLTTLVILRLAKKNMLTLDSPIAALLPDAESEEKLQGITVQQILCHTSSLRDTDAYIASLNQGATWKDVLRHSEVISGNPGEHFAYCNFAFGLLGCMIEHITNESLEAVFRREVFEPLEMDAVIDGSLLDPTNVTAIKRVISLHPASGIRVTSLGAKAIDRPDPLRHFGHTAGAVYTTAESLGHVFRMLANDGLYQGKRFLPAHSIQLMKQRHATYGTLSPHMHYGLGLFLLEDPHASDPKIAYVGHQGYAYGCVDGAFIECATGNIMISLNGGASEAREGRLGLLNRDLIRWCFGKELPSWR